MSDENASKKKNMDPIAGSRCTMEMKTYDKQGRLKEILQVDEFGNETTIYNK